MARLVVITRPRDEAESLSAALQARGYSTLIEPMLKIVEIRAAIPDMNSFDALAFTSANGVRFFTVHSGERGLPAFAVGDKTADLLRAAGFEDIRAASGDALALGGLIRATAPAISRILHVTGTATARDLAKLVDPGQAIDRLVLYGAIAADDFSADLVDALYACTVGYVLFFSSRTAAAFGTLIGKLGLTEMICSCSALCLSPQVAAAVADLPWAAVRVAVKPTADSLLSLLPAEPADG
jgi:uroporphyrinogen-III synthase